MRARMALIYAQINFEHREIELKNKPSCMLTVSPKGTVPVLVLPDGQVIDESLDIMKWAFRISDPDCWLDPESISTQLNWITENDNHFKYYLDRYKYPSRYNLENGIEDRNECFKWLTSLNDAVAKHGFICADSLQMVDVAIFPFIRQFALVDQNWFNSNDLVALQKWLKFCLSLTIFEACMQKIPVWKD